MGRADESHAGHALGVLQRKQRGNGAPHGVAREVGLFDAQRVQQRAQALGVCGVVVRLVVQPRALAKTREIWGNHPVLAGEGARKIHPMVLLRKNAVQKHQGRGAWVAGRRSGWRTAVQVVDGVQRRGGGFLFHAREAAVEVEQGLLQQRRGAVIEAHATQHEGGGNRNEGNAFQESVSKRTMGCRGAARWARAGAGQGYREPCRKTCRFGLCRSAPTP